MKLAILTLDEIAFEDAKQIADRLGHTLQCWWPKEGSPDGLFDALIYDVNSSAPERGQREGLVRMLCTEPLSCSVAVYGYSLDDAQTHVLQQHGVLVRCRFMSELLEELCASADSFRLADPPEELSASDVQPALQVAPVK